MNLDGQTYVLSFFLPNLYFHITTACNLLRMQAGTIGKRDYMGMQAMGQFATCGPRPSRHHSCTQP